MSMDRDASHSQQALRRQETSRSSWNVVVSIKSSSMAPVIDLMKHLHTITNSWSIRAYMTCLDAVDTMIQ
jgi:hypothetical protein